MIEILNEVAAELRGQVINLEEIRYHAFKRTVQFIGGDDNSLAAHLNVLYLKHRFEEIELYPDVLAVLDSLQKDYPIGLLSNGNGYPERCGLQDRFSFVIFSQDVGIEKPDPEIFYAECRQMDCVPSELMHIGDSLAADVVGAQRAGAVSVWLNRDGARNGTTARPDFEIQSLTEIVDNIRLLLR